jgi:hypothetical protein
MGECLGCLLIMSYLIPPSRRPEPAQEGVYRMQERRVFESRHRISQINRTSRINFIQNLHTYVHLFILLSIFYSF